MSDGVPEATTQRGERIFLEIVPGRQPGVPVSREAAAALSRGREPMEPGSPNPPSREGGDSQ